LLFLAAPRPPPSTLSPYTTLFRSPQNLAPHGCEAGRGSIGLPSEFRQLEVVPRDEGALVGDLLIEGIQLCASLNGLRLGLTPDLDRKSTRLNSSHVKISYAVFCLK